MHASPLSVLEFNQYTIQDHNEVKVRPQGLKSQNPTFIREAYIYENPVKSGFLQIEGGFQGPPDPGPHKFELIFVNVNGQLSAVMGQ